MQTILGAWERLETRKKAMFFAVFAVTAIVAILFARMVASPHMALLYSGLDQKAAGQVIATLDARGVAYSVKNSAIYVPEAQRDELRLSLAAEGMPPNTTQGYELLDGLTGFGTTTQMFDAAYLRAKEGELARTILANPAITAARVHIGQKAGRGFSRVGRSTASVSLKMAGGTVPRDAAKAIRFLVASAVVDLDLADVVVVDANNGLVLAEDQDIPSPQVGMELAQTLRQNILRLLEARTGPGNAIVEVNVDTYTDEEKILEHRYDPEGRVIVSTQTEELSKSSQNTGGAGVTVASNLPEGDAAAGDTGSSSQDNDTRETVNYELSQTTREFRRLPGSIKRLSVAVLLNEPLAEDGSGTQQARSPEELADLEQLVMSASGFDETRGDSVTIKSMPLAATDLGQLPAGEGSWAAGRGLDYMRLSQLGLAAAVVLGLSAFVLKPIAMAALSQPQPDTNVNALPPTSETALPALSGDITSPGEALPELSLTDATRADEDPVERLKSLVAERQDETVEVLRSWIETPQAEVHS